jgi:mxaA protein
MSTIARSSRRLCALLAIVLMGLCAVAFAAPAPVAVVEQPRAFGHFVGDRLQQRVLLDRQGDTLEPTALPQPRRLGVWIERLSSRTETDSTGRSWLTVDYLIINAASTLTTIKIPGWELKCTTRKDGSTAVQTIPPWTINVAALTPVEVPTAEALQPDRPAPLIATGLIAHRLQVSFGALIATLLSWLGWVLWRNWRASARQPFASARRQLRGLDESDVAAWHILHRAFERSAGGAVQRSSLDRMFDAMPHLKPLRAEIEQFFERSEAFFFAGNKAHQSIDLHGLCAKLRRLEKRHER